MCGHIYIYIYIYASYEEGARLAETRLARNSVHHTKRFRITITSAITMTIVYVNVYFPFCVSSQKHIALRVSSQARNSSNH